MLTGTWFLAYSSEHNRSRPVGKKQKGKRTIELCRSDSSFIKQSSLWNAKILLKWAKNEWVFTQYALFTSLFKHYIMHSLFMKLKDTYLSFKLLPLDTYNKLCLSSASKVKYNHFSRNYIVILLIYLLKKSWSITLSSSLSS